MRRIVLVAAMVLAGCSTIRGRTGATVPPASAPIPRDAARFEIESVDDSTARFRRAEATWIRPGTLVYAVDPAKRDALVARLRVLGTDSGRMTALVTSQVTRVTTEHFLLAVKPTVRWYRDARFWWGLAGGGAVGATGAVIAR
ncbi:MAG TPA: hypothetical protein VE869_16365 [Gemmatimonas sp.]|nr:hypothetical protein [Gemmatimonas sp.]